MLFLKFHQGIQQILQIVLIIEFQFKATFLFAGHNFNAAAQVLAQLFFALCHIVFA